MMNYELFTRLRRDDLLREADRMRLARVASGERRVSFTADTVRRASTRLEAARRALFPRQTAPAACATCPV